MAYYNSLEFHLNYYIYLHIAIIFFPFYHSVTFHGTWYGTMVCLTLSCCRASGSFLAMLRALAHRFLCVRLFPFSGINAQEWTSTIFDSCTLWKTLMCCACCKSIPVAPQTNKRKNITSYHILMFIFT